MVKLSPPKAVGDFFGYDYDLRQIADGHFPNDCAERRKLIQIAESCEVLVDFYLGLHVLRKTLQKIKEAGLPKEFEVLHHAAVLERLSQASASQIEASELKRASELMFAWNALSSSLDDVMAASESFTLGALFPKQDAS